MWGTARCALCLRFSEGCGGLPRKIYPQITQIPKIDNAAISAGAVTAIGLKLRNLCNSVDSYLGSIPINFSNESWTALYEETSLELLLRRAAVFNLFNAPSNAFISSTNSVFLSPDNASGTPAFTIAFQRFTSSPDCERMRR